MRKYVDNSSGQRTPFGTKTNEPYFTFGQCGSCIFSQFRYALSRQSSIHSGSPFLPEMRRITSSFNPAGTTSDSMSVTKPYLYGCWTWASMLVMELLEVLYGY